MCWFGLLQPVSLQAFIACTLELEAVLCDHADDKEKKNLNTSSPSPTSFPSPSSVPLCTSTERTLG